MDFTKENIKSEISSKIIGNEIVFFDEIDSTNRFLKENCSNYMEGCIVVAKSQVDGKGRRGNTWENNPCESIYMSILLKPGNIKDISILTLVTGLSVFFAINNDSVKIKWPNDLIINEKKFGGILAELVEDSEGCKNLIIGIGINVSNKVFHNRIKDKATSLLLEKIEMSIPQLISGICKEVEKSYFKFIEKGFKPFVNDYKKVCITIGSDVKVLTGTREEIGKIIDINLDGTLLFEDSTHHRKNIFAGEVSIRGLNGYV